jgi:Spy/CpxP family protein refolding chaperone
MNRDSQPGIRRAGPEGPRSGPGGGGPAANLLRLRTQLELTDDQVKQLESMRTAARPTLNQADMLRARADLMDATKSDVNVEKARGAFDRMARLRTDLQVAHLKSRQDVRNVLTPVQRTKLDALATNMRARRGDAMRGRGGQVRGQKRGPQVRGRPGNDRGTPFGPGPGLRGAPNVGPGNQPGVGRGRGPGGFGRRGQMNPGGPQSGMPPGPPNAAQPGRAMPPIDSLR